MVKTSYIESLAYIEAHAAYDLFIKYGIKPFILQVNTLYQEIFINKFSKIYSDLMEGGGIDIIVID